jgi:peroxiredoxin/predicted 2-oxoglutarate/Fe(II)-dependent dioxygenase YbiX
VARHRPTHPVTVPSGSRPPAVGEPAPWFTCRTGKRERFAFDTIAGRYIVLTFLGSAREPAAARFLERILAVRARFDDRTVSFFGVSIDPDDEPSRRIADMIPGIRYFRDHDRAVSSRYGAVGAEGAYRRITYLLDPSLRVLAVLPFTKDSGDHAADLLARLDRLPAIPASQPAALQAPVLVLPRIFEPEFCTRLVEYYQAHGSEDSGFMLDLDGTTRAALAYSHKRRRDCNIEDRDLQEACMARIRRRLAPEIHKAFQFQTTRMERCIVACYDAADRGHFRPHRDNTTSGTAHRRFAVSLFLNSGEYEGGFLRFPEYGPALYSAPLGGAVVFSCSVLHEATPVTRGRRYMFLPFLYDEPARQIREQNLRFVDVGPIGGASS